MILLFSLLSILSTSPLLHADEIWKVNGAKLEFRKADGKVLVAKCQVSCEALRVLKRKSPAYEHAPSEGDANPAAVFCKKQGGLVVTGTDKAQNENSFCEFRDGSLISTASLYSMKHR